MKKRIGGLSVQAASETSAQNCYETPLALVERIHTVLGGIELDPCTTSLNPVGATRFYTPDDDGILQAWDAATIYMNPPYGRTIKHWVEKARTAAQNGSKVIMLVPARTCSDWFHGAMADASDVLFIRRRLKFNDQGTGFTDNTPFPSVLVGFGVDLSPLADLGTRVARLHGAA